MYGLAEGCVSPLLIRSSFGTNRRVRRYLVGHNREWHQQQQMFGLIVDHSFLPDPNTDDFILVAHGRNGAQTGMFRREFERRRITAF
jgi:hypothetical protein